MVWRFEVNISKTEDLTIIDEQHDLWVTKVQNSASINAGANSAPSQPYKPPLLFPILPSFSITQEWRPNASPHRLNRRISSFLKQCFHPTNPTSRSTVPPRPQSPSPSRPGLPANLCRLKLSIILFSSFASFFSPQPLWSWLQNSLTLRPPSSKRSLSASLSYIGHASPLPLSRRFSLFSGAFILVFLRPR